MNMLRLNVKIHCDKDTINDIVTSIQNNSKLKNTVDEVGLQKHINIIQQAVGFEYTTVSNFESVVRILTKQNIYTEELKEIKDIIYKLILKELEKEKEHE